MTGKPISPPATTEVDLDPRDLMPDDDSFEALLEADARARAARIPNSPRVSASAAGMAPAPAAAPEPKPLGMLSPEARLDARDIPARRRSATREEILELAASVFTIDPNAAEAMVNESASSTGPNLGRIVMRGDGTVYVELTRSERARLHAIASARCNPKIARGVRSKKVSSDRTELQIHVDGVKAEYAAARCLGVEIDTSSSLRGDDGIADLRIGERTVQVKFRYQLNCSGYLYFNHAAEFRADYAVCCSRVADRSGAERADVVAVCGYIDRAAFLERAGETDDMQHGTRIAIEPRHLRPIGELARVGERFQLEAWLDRVGRQLRELETGSDRRLRAERVWVAVMRRYETLTES